MGLVSQRDSKNLKHFIDAPLQPHIVLHDCYKTISDYGTVDLDADSILRCPPELLDAQMLPDPFEEQLLAPSVAIQLGDCLCRCRQIVGRESLVSTNVFINLIKKDVFHFGN